MKSLKSISLLFVVVILLLSNCTIQKRKHRNGYYIDWHKKSTNVVAEKTGSKKDFVASADDKINLPKKEEVNFSSQSSVACGDTIYLLNGSKIICQLIEIDDEFIKYKVCDNIDGPLYSKKTQSAQKIVFLNGTSEVFNIAHPNNDTIKKQRIDTSLNNSFDPKSKILDEGNTKQSPKLLKKKNRIGTKRAENSNLDLPKSAYSALVMLVIELITIIVIMITKEPLIALVLILSGSFAFIGGLISLIVSFIFPDEYRGILLSIIIMLLSIIIFLLFFTIPF